MIVRAFVATLLVASTLFLRQGVEAGGWASVRVADELPAPVAGEPWNVELVVRQHDKAAVNVDELSVSFTHQESRATVNTLANSTGQLGHYAISVVLDQPGIWDWTATPAPYGPMTMESLQVLETAATSDLGAPRLVIVQGTCAAPGLELGELALTGADDSIDGGTATGIIPDFGEIAARSQSDEIAVIIERTGSAGSAMACGELSASDLSSPSVQLLNADSDSTTIASLSIVPVDGGVTATVTVLSIGQDQGVVIRIVDTGEGAFSPGSITIPAGTTVTWQNDGAIAHTVAGTTAGFLSSGMLDHGERFSQSFDEPGVYPYACGPHTWMTGTITVV